MTWLQVGGGWQRGELVLWDITEKMGQSLGF